MLTFLLLSVPSRHKCQTVEIYEGSNHSKKIQGPFYTLLINYTIEYITFELSIYNYDKYVRTY